MPLISIVVPVYGVEQYITNVVRSMCKQTFTDYEIVLVDDKSPDKSIELAEKELQKHTVQYQIIRQENQGVSVARNTGIQSAQGQWIICIDSDDELHPQTLEILAKAIAQEPATEAFGINLLRTRCSGVTEHRELQNNGTCDIYLQREITEALLLGKVCLFAPGLLIKKSFLQKHNLAYRKDVRYSEDLLFVWHVLGHIKSFGYVKEQLYYYLKRPGSTMHTSQQQKILTGYVAFEELHKLVFDKKLTLGDLGNYVFPRWVMGVLHSTAKYMNYSEFKKLAKVMDYRNNAKGLKNFPQRKVVLMSMLMRVNLYMFYISMKKL